MTNVNLNSNGFRQLQTNQAKQIQQNQAKVENEAKDLKTGAVQEQAQTEFVEQGESLLNQMSVMADYNTLFIMKPSSGDALATGAAAKDTWLPTPRMFPCKRVQSEIIKNSDGTFNYAGSTWTFDKNRHLTKEVKIEGNTTTTILYDTNADGQAIDTSKTVVEKGEPTITTVYTYKKDNPVYKMPETECKTVTKEYSKTNTTTKDTTHFTNGQATSCTSVEKKKSAGKTKTTTIEYDIVKGKLKTKSKTIEEGNVTTTTEYASGKANFRTRVEKRKGADGNISTITTKYTISNGKSTVISQAETVKEGNNKTTTRETPYKKGKPSTPITITETTKNGNTTTDTEYNIINKSKVLKSQTRTTVAGNKTTIKTAVGNRIEQAKSYVQTEIVTDGDTTTTEEYNVTNSKKVFQSQTIITGNTKTWTRVDGNTTTTTVYDMSSGIDVPKTKTVKTDTEEDGNKMVTIKEWDLNCTMTNGKITHIDTIKKAYTEIVTDGDTTTTTKETYKEGKLASKTEIVEDGNTTTTTEYDKDKVIKTKTITVKADNTKTISGNERNNELAALAVLEGNGNTTSTKFTYKDGKLQYEDSLNANNEIIARIEYSTSTGKRKKETEFSYDENGLLLTKTVYTLGSETEERKSKTEYIYGENQWPLTKIESTYDGVTEKCKNKTEYLYDENGEPSTQIEYTYNNETRKWSSGTESPRTYTSVDNGNGSVTMKDEFGTQRKKEVSVYNDEGCFATQPYHYDLETKKWIMDTPVFYNENNDPVSLPHTTFYAKSELGKKFRNVVNNLASKIEDSYLKERFYEAMLFIDYIAETGDDTVADNAETTAKLNKSAGEELMKYIVRSYGSANSKYNIEGIELYEAPENGVSEVDRWCWKQADNGKWILQVNKGEENQSINDGFTNSNIASQILMGFVYDMVKSGSNKSSGYDDDDNENVKKACAVRDLYEYAYICYARPLSNTQTIAKKSEYGVSPSELYKYCAA